MEDEDQRGVAHIVEHLAFSATTRYTNHDIVKFLESIGAEFGPCQNAMTTADETIYELFVPVDKPELLSQAISILAEFSSEVKLSLWLCFDFFFFKFVRNCKRFVFLDSSLEGRFGKRKRCCYGRVPREQKCYWKDAGFALAVDDGRFKGIVRLFFFLIIFAV